MDGVRAVLIDIDGVLTVSWEPLPGAVEAVQALRDADLPFALVTNTTSRTRARIAETLAGAGFPVGSDDVLGAPAATAAHLREHHPGAACLLLSSGDVADDLEGVRLVGPDDEVDVVVVGGAGPEFSYEALDNAYGHLQNGAALVAMHRTSTGAPTPVSSSTRAPSCSGWRRRPTPRRSCWASRRARSSPPRSPRSVSGAARP
jgi:HAD superfamily hydrolase (TIGR01450 family)